MFTEVIAPNDWKQRKGIGITPTSKWLGLDSLMALASSRPLLLPQEYSTAAQETKYAGDNLCYQDRTRLYRHARQFRPTVASELQPVFDAIDESKRILEWPDNWDGAGSLGFTKATWDRAARFVRDNAVQLWEDAGKIMDAPDIQPGEGGRIIIEWSLDDRELIVAIPPDAEAQADYYGYDREQTMTIKGKLDTTSPQNAWLLLWTVK